MSLYQVLSNHIHRLLEEIHQETGVSRQDLERIRNKWDASPVLIDTTTTITTSTDNEFATTVNTTKKNHPVKKSGYQVFFTQNCSTLKRSHPEWTFGDLSREISRQWNALSIEERKLYIPEQKPEVVVAVAGSSSSLVVPTSASTAGKTSPNHKRWTFETLNDMKMADLRTICESRGLRRTGNKQELIRVILNHDPAPVKPKTIMPPTMNVNDETLEVMTSDKLKRTDIEDDEEAIVFVGSEDEGDFVFEDEGSENNPECEDHDDLEEDQDLDTEE